MVEIGCGKNLRKQECFVLSEEGKLLAHFREGSLSVWKTSVHGWHECGTGKCEYGMATAKTYCRTCAVKLGLIW